MSPYEIKTFIAAELPAATEEIGKIADADQPYKIMAGLSNFARKRLRAHDLSAVVKCLKLAEDICQKGNLIVKNAVEHVFVFSCTSLRNSCDQVEWKVIRQKCPKQFISYTKSSNTFREPDTAVIVFRCISKMELTIKK